MKHSSTNMAALLKAAREKKEREQEAPEILPPVPAPPAHIQKTERSLAKLSAMNINGTKTGRIPMVESAVKEVQEVPVPEKPIDPLARLKASIAAKTQEPSPEVIQEIKQAVTELPTTSPTGMHGEAITYNLQQAEFITTASSGADCVLIGAAGTGKTTCSQGAIQALLATGNIPALVNDGHKYLVNGTPGILIISYTRRAVNNIRKVQSPDLQNCCITAHKLLEYAPEYFETWDDETQAYKNTMRFVATRNEYKPLPDTIHTIIVEEASMLSTELIQEILDALQHPVQWIFIGDIQQLPPVFGSAILGYKMAELPTTELTTVYRQALESPIIRLAHRILSGDPIPAEEYTSWKHPAQLTLHPWKKKLHPDIATATLAAFFTKALDTGDYNVDEDMILIPYNKACGTLEINKYIANHIARKNDTITHEVIAGFSKHYFSEGDKVLYDREDAKIVEISKNLGYSGARYQRASSNLDYWGHNPKAVEESTNAVSDMVDGMDTSDANIDFLLEQAVASEDRVTQASHELVIRLLDTGSEITITKAAEVNALLHSYALTVHKSQGSEWRKVFFILHQSHAAMLQRELLYTAVTRAKEELYVICEPESFTKGILSQRIKGNTLEEKIESFKGKITNRGGS